MVRKGLIGYESFFIASLKSLILAFVALIRLAILFSVLRAVS